MKLIIDISDKTYEIIRDMMYFYNPQRSGRAETKEIITAIKQGTPLPKGHGDLIDRKEVMENMELEADGYCDFDCYKPITDAPTIIEADKEN